MGIVEQDESCWYNASWYGIPRLPHDQEDCRDSQSPEKGRQSSESDVRHIIGDVGVSNVIKKKVPVVADEPAHKSEKKLPKRRVNIEEICSL